MEGGGFNHISGKYLFYNKTNSSQNILQVFRLNRMRLLVIVSVKQSAYSQHEAGVTGI